MIVFNLCHDLYSGTVETTDAQSTEQENIIVSSFPYEHPFILHCLVFSV